MSITLATTHTFLIQTCGSCGVVFAMTAEFQGARQSDRKTWYCPNGCARAFTGKTEEQRLREQLERANARVTFERDQHAAAERSASAYKGVATRLRNRIAAGQCPCCNQTFADLANHIAGEHPDFTEGDNR